MAASYITLEELRASLQLPQGDEAGLLAAIEAAESAIDAFCNAAPHGLASKEVTETQRGRGMARHFVLRPMITAVGACQVNGVAVPVEIWDRTSVVRADGGLFEDGARISLTYTAGHDPLPASLKHAAVLTASAFYTAPTFEMNTSNQAIDGVMSGMAHQLGTGSIPPGALRILQPLVWMVPL